MTHLTGDQLLRYGICIADDGEQLSVFDMEKFKAAMADAEESGIHSADNLWHLFNVGSLEDISPEVQRVFLASFHMFQSLYRITMLTNTLSNYIRKQGLRVDMNVALDLLRQIRTASHISQRIALEGTEAVSFSLKKP